MKWLTTIAAIMALAILPARADLYNELAGDVNARTALIQLLDDAFAREVKNLKKRAPDCFHGEFRRDVELYFKSLARNTDLHKRILEFVGTVLTEDEIRSLMAFAKTKEGYKTLTNFIGSIRPFGKENLKTGHVFFTSPVGMKIVDNMPKLKRNAIWHGTLILKDNGYGAYDVLMEELNWQFKCKEDEE